MHVSLTLNLGTNGGEQTKLAMFVLPARAPPFQATPISRPGGLPETHEYNITSAGAADREVVTI